MAIPVSLEDAKRQLRQGGEDLDDERVAEINGFVADAAGWVERYTGHILAARNVTEQFDGFGDLTLRAWPVKSTAQPAVSYGDPGATATTISGARISVAKRPARVLAPIAAPWPGFGSGSTVSVTIRAGYEPDDAVPGNMRRAMLVLIAAYDQDREGGEVLQLAEKTARGLCRDYRLRRL